MIYRVRGFDGRKTAHRLPFLGKAKAVAVRDRVNDWCIEVSFGRVHGPCGALEMPQYPYHVERLTRRGWRTDYDDLWGGRVE